MKRYGLILLAVLAVGGVAVLFAARTDKTPDTTTTTAAPKFEIDDTAKKNPWTGLTPNWSSEQFQFAVVADRTGGHRAKVFSQAVYRINLLQPNFVMSVGDLIEGYSTKEEKLAEEWDDLAGRSAAASNTPWPSPSDRTCSPKRRGTPHSSGPAPPWLRRAAGDWSDAWGAERNGSTPSAKI